MRPQDESHPSKADRQEEQLLVVRARTDPLAFGRLFDMHYERILNYVLRRTADVYVAQELTSNVFYKAMKTIGRFRWRGVPFAAWLYRIATNEVNMHHRRQSRARTLDISGPHGDERVDPNAGADHEIIEAQRAVAENRLFMELYAAISELDLKYQDVIVLHYFEGKSLEEIKQILGKPIGSLKSRLHRGRNQLRARLSSAYLKLVE